MPLIYNGTTIDTIVYNGVTLDKVIYNGVTVWEGIPEPDPEPIKYLHTIKLSTNPSWKYGHCDCTLELVLDTSTPITNYNALIGVLQSLSVTEVPVTGTCYEDEIYNLYN